MEPIVLKASSQKGHPIQATFLPAIGMNLTSLKFGNTEVIDQSTQSLFEERCAGLGALIGPHFHHRRADVLPKIGDESLFPHIARVRAKGVQEPFSHGVARYAPWKAEATESTVKAVVTGKDLWNGVSLESLEGQNFTMRFEANLTTEGLEIDLSVVSDSDSLVGLHYYYHLPQGTGTVQSTVQREYIENNERKPLPPEWTHEGVQALQFDLKNEADYTFHPYPSPREGKILLDTGSYQLLTTYTCPSAENGWQLYHPKGASYVCIEPISAKDPRHPNLTVSSLHVKIDYL